LPSSLGHEEMGARPLLQTMTRWVARSSSSRHHQILSLLPWRVLPFSLRREVLFTSLPCPLLVITRASPSRHEEISFWSLQSPLIPLLACALSTIIARPSYSPSSETSFFRSLAGLFLLIISRLPSSSSRGSLLVRHYELHSSWSLEASLFFVIGSPFPLRDGEASSLFVIASLAPSNCQIRSQF